MIHVLAGQERSIKTVMADNYIGLMSGTSLDGVDAVVVDDSCTKVIANAYFPYPEELKQNLLNLTKTQQTNLSDFAQVDIQVAGFFANCANNLLANNNIDKDSIRAIGSHGQTIFHLPAEYSMQIGHGAIIAEKTGVDVVSDFRMADVANFGQGAPLTPVYHQHLLGGNSAVVINLGGICNATIINNDEVVGFDTGPANTLIDNWMRKVKNIDFDRDGIFSRSGFVLEDMLDSMLNDEYFAKAYPKSTGPEYFNLKWLDQYLPQSYNDEDVARTLIELSSITIAQSIPQGADVYLCGGGMHNLFLSERIAFFAPHSEVSTTNDLGVHVDFVEAAAFAYLAKLRLENTPGNLPSVTGARTEKILGALHAA